MKSLVFDSSTIISLATNNLLWLIRPLRQKFKGTCYLSKTIKHELVDYPLTTKKFKFEAIVINDLIKEDYFELYGNPLVSKESDKLIEISNEIFFARGKGINILQKAEVEGLIIAKNLNSEAYVVDERSLRAVIESPENLKKLLQNKLHTNVTVNKNNLSEFQRRIHGVKLIRSTELAVVAYDLKLLERYITAKKKVDNKLKKPLLEGVLWGLKLKGCAISHDEINEILREKFK